jgi:hypothetical protein
MTPHANNLDRIERWMQAVIMHPAGVQSGICSEDAQRQFPVSPEQVEQVVTRSESLTAIERLGIYANAYYARLLECLRQEFPSLAHALGEDAFDAHAVNYLRERPSTSYTLADLGADFPKFLARSIPEADASAGDEAPGFRTWMSFLIELAGVERLYSEVFDGPGVEGQRLLEAARLEAIPPSNWPQVRLIPVCCLKLLTLRFPVHEYITAVRQKLDPAPPQRADTYLAVTRRNYIIRRVPLSRPQFLLLSALVGGTPVGEAIGQAATSFEGGDNELADSLRHWFFDWAAAGFFKSVSKPI